MGNFRYKLMQFMQGRYGIDKLNKFLAGAFFVCWLLGIFIHRGFSKISFLLMLIYIFRMLSRNYNQRYRENQIYMKYSEGLRYKFADLKKNAEYRKTHKIFKCPVCKKKLSIPKGKGTLEVSCPCGNKIRKKS